MTPPRPWSSSRSRGSPLRLGVAWHTANHAVLAEGRRLLIDDPARFDGVRGVISIDEHVWRHTRRGDKYVTVIIKDLTPTRNKTRTCSVAGHGGGPLQSRLQGRWLEVRPKAWKDRIEVVAMDGFTGFKTATSEVLPGAVAVMDPFHVVRPGTSNQTHGGDQRPPRAPPRLRPRFPATSPTTSPAAPSNPEASETSYALGCDEPEDR